jgi:hypothetical protein
MLQHARKCCSLPLSTIQGKHASPPGYQKGRCTGHVSARNNATNSSTMTMLKSQQQRMPVHDNQHKCQHFNATAIITLSMLISAHQHKSPQHCSFTLPRWRFKSRAGRRQGILA